MKLPTRNMLTRNKLIARLEPYGFIECGVILNFLQYVCERIPCNASYRFMYTKLNECLKNHSGNLDSPHFTDMRKLAVELEYISSLSKS